MPAPCPEAPPDYFLPVLHCIAGISAPINILGLYLVLYKSPAISKYKYCIFYVQTASFLTEIQMSVVAPGYYFFPMLAGFHTNQYVAKVIKNNHVLMTIWLFFLANELPAIVWCFVYRHNAAENMNRDSQLSTQHSRIFKKFALVACQLFPFIVATCFYNSDITREEAKEYLTNNYPQCLYWLDSSVFALYDWRTNRMVAVSGIGALIYVIIFAGYGFSLGIRTMLLLHQLRHMMSQATYRMHRTALIGLTLQVILPSFLLILPLFVCFYVIALDKIELQGVATNSTVLICFHSVSATIVMIAANPRYRKIVGGWFCVVCKRKKPSTSSVAIEPSSTNFRRIVHSTSTR